MSWNYRVMSLDGGKSFGIHEVYYDPDNKPKAYTLNSVRPFGESLDELRKDISLMLKAAEKPIMTPQDFPEEFTYVAEDS
jgi:hypothetical protein